MLPVLFTIDTEYSSGLFSNGVARDRAENFSRCIACETDKGPVGIHYQMDVFDRLGHKAVFFVDPMPALVWGPEAVEEVVTPILQRGHEVQLHLHTEWLAHAADNPLGSKTGQNLADFDAHDQKVLLEYAIEQLIAAGAPRPVAFRAGNYGANDDTLGALSELGLEFDSSHPPGIANSACGIGLGAGDLLPTQRNNVTELPIGVIEAAKDTQRHAQLTALSHAELAASVDHAFRNGWPAFVIVSHSFEMMNRQRRIPNQIVKARFEKFCESVAKKPDCRMVGLAELDAAQLVQASESVPRPVQTLRYRATRTAWRTGEQALANLLYG